MNQQEGSIAKALNGQLSALVCVASVSQPILQILQNYPVLLLGLDECQFQRSR